MKQGQVAQSVEQGTENPRVGGSIPSLATFFMVLLSSITTWGCQTDHCDTLCVRSANVFGRCIALWEASDWGDFDAEDRRGFQEACQNRWSVERAELESRELVDALEQCEETIVALDEMAQNNTTCDELRAIFLW